MRPHGFDWLPVRFPRWPALALVLLLGGCAYALVRDGAVDLAKVGRIEADLQSLRQLTFKREVPIVVRNRAQAAQMMSADIARDYSDEQFKLDGIAGSLLGLYPAGIDLKAASLKLLRSQVAGFYDPHGKQMVLVEGGVSPGFWVGTAQFFAQRDLMGEMLLAHELTHALQDQYFDLEGALNKVKHNEDRETALKSVAEGDAMLAGFGYVAGRLDPVVARTLVSRMKDLPRTFVHQSPDTPRGLAEPLLFQYSGGTRFVAEAYRRGGWAAVDALYRDPPQSTQQILHPELYFDRLTPPTEVSLSGYEKVLAQWEKALDGAYGELLLSIILKRNLGDGAVDVALARRWAGDHMVILKKGSAVTVLWLVAFRDESSASRFAAVYSSLLDRMLGTTTAHEIEFRKKAVLIAAGDGAGKFPELASAIWNATVFRTVRSRKVARPNESRARAVAAAVGD